MTYSIEAQNISKSFGKHKVLNGISLSVPQGSVLALLGPNGAGKTTAVRILTTLMKPDKGRILVGGFDAVREPQKVQSIIGVTGQSTSIDEKLTGMDNLVMFGQLHRLRTKDARIRAEQLLTQFDLTKAADKPVKSYSGGMKRRLDLAVSLIVAPPILFLDEPSTGLDPTSRAAVWENIRQLVNDGTTVLLTTQYLDEADQLAHNIVFIDDGHVVAQGTPAQLKAQLGATYFNVTAATNDDFRALNVLLSKQIVASDAKTRTISVAVVNTTIDGLRDLAAIIARVTAAHIALDNYALQQPSLDDVFTQLISQTIKENK